MFTRVSKNFTKFSSSAGNAKSIRNYYYTGPSLSMKSEKTIFLPAVIHTNTQFTPIHAPRTIFNGKLFDDNLVNFLSMDKELRTCWATEEIMNIVWLLRK